MFGEPFVDAPSPFPRETAGSKKVNVAAIDNGWLVTINNPIHQAGEVEKLYTALATILPSINMGAGAGAVRGMDEEMDSYKQSSEDRAKGFQAKMEAIQKVVKEAFQDQPTLRKPVEVYGFIDFEAMMKFLREELSPK